MVKVLAPIGSLEKGISLFENTGVSAVYFSPKRAGNPKLSWGRRRAWHALTYEEIIEIIERGKEHGVNEFHIAMNNSVEDKDFPAFMSEVEKYSKLGITNITLCEPGTVRKVKSEFPHLKIDLSIMAYATSSQDAKFFKDLGVSFIALPYLELSQVKAIKDTGVNLKVFILGFNNRIRRGCCYNSAYVGSSSFNLDGTCIRACAFEWSAKIGGVTYENLHRDAGPFNILKNLGDYLEILGPEDYLKVQGREWPVEVVNSLVDITNRISRGEHVSEAEINAVDERRKGAMKGLTEKMHSDYLRARSEPKDFSFRGNSKKELNVSLGDLETLLGLDLEPFDAVYFGRADKCDKREPLDFEKAIEHVDKQGKKIYLILPAILKDPDYGEISLPVLSQADGVEIHNFGLLNFLKEKGYEKEIVGGAWLNIYNSQTAEELKERGVKRILLPYEASAEMLSYMEKDFDVEVLVHGHLPLTITNLCLREHENNDLSCNKCRSPIDAEFQGKWIRHDGNTTLSGPHLCLYEHMDKLSGLRVFRIEGQTLDAYSLSQIGRIYRARLDGSSSDGLKVLRSFSEHGFCNGFMFGVAGYRYITKGGIQNG